MKERSILDDEVQTKKESLNQLLISCEISHFVILNAVKNLHQQGD